MEFPPFDLASADWLLPAIGAAASLIALSIFLLLIIPVVRCRRACDTADIRPQVSGRLDGASVIVYSADEYSLLAQLLPRLLAQEYDAEFEVIVVNEGDSPQVRDVVESMQISHRNLYLTHTPEGARNLSRKKLAITLGVKAARYPVVVLTRAGAVIDSDRWLASIMRHFSPDNHTELVLGYAAAAPYEDTGWGRRTRSFDNVADSTIWLSDALRGHPWRGTEFNLAYTRELFFRVKGFSSHLNLRDGDDDIFISSIATEANTAVELSLESIVEVPGNNTRRIARERLRRRMFTSRFISRRPRLLHALAWVCYAAGFVVPVIAAALPPYNLATWACAAAALLLWYPAGMVWIMADRALCGRRLLLTLPFLAATRPLRRCAAAIAARLRHSKRYTWE